ncbi:hypothetical protein M413DRAFT_27184 [Hebeloma cylindrosporum]|uniref:F-box domain-containing protein n=1 Tax=Hebeloma cylindrosporum TaxID=76867 RepID=A0A0C2XXM3_HEBCY|nr:hypothetical protein M413DRAFT_27184 [Hebeloma cylindrosporum h7]
MNKTAKPSDFVASRILLRHIAQMTEVKSLTIGCYPSDDVEGFKAAASFVHTAWSSLRSRLRILNLAIPLEAYSISKIFPPGLVLESLEELTIVLRKAYNNTDDGEIIASIIPFINRQHKSLTSLTIDIPEAKVDPSPLFNALQRFPDMKKLSIVHPVDRLQPADRTGIDVFLEKHAQQLEEFKIRFYVTDSLPIPSEFFSHPIFKISLPRLTCLDLGLFQWPKLSQPDVTDGIVRYVGRMCRPLTRLAIRDCVLAYPQVVSLFSVISSEASKLRSLEMHVYFLSCSLLDLLSQQLPKLYHLELRFDSLMSQEDGTWIANYYWNGYDNQASAFVRDMADRKYPDWALRHFTVRPLYYCSGRWDESRQVLASALPAVISFNGLSGDEFVDIPDYTKSLA